MSIGGKNIINDEYTRHSIGRPCPYCGTNKVTISLHMDCYSSWSIVSCDKCYASLTISADKENLPYPNPMKFWYTRALKKWDDQDAEIQKELIFTLKRGELPTLFLNSIDAGPIIFSMKSSTGSRYIKIKGVKSNEI